MNAATILFLAANPHPSLRLALDEEAREIEERIQPRSCKIPLNLRTCWAARPDDLLLALNRDRPAVVHFSGHGAGDPGLVFHDEAGRETLVSGTALQSLFRTLKDDIRVVVLNACYSEVQARLICEVIDCVVGMSRSIGDSAARRFAAAFYGALAHGRDVQNAYEQGLVSLEFARLRDEDIPRLLVRVGVTASAVQLGPRGKPEAGRIRFVIKLQGSATEIDDEFIARLTDLLRQRSADMTLVIETVREGSILLTVLATEAGHQRLVELVERGELPELIGRRIMAVERAPAATGGIRAKVYFRNLHGGSGAVELTDSSRIYIGRAADCEIRTDDVTVSRKHAQIGSEEDRFYVDDLGTPTGTYVNDVRIAGRHWLRHGDEILCGSLLLRHVEEDQARSDSGRRPAIGVGTFIPVDMPPPMAVSGAHAPGPVTSEGSWPTLHRRTTGESPSTIARRDDNPRELRRALDAAQLTIERLQSAYEREVAEGQRLRAELALRRERAEALRRALVDLAARAETDSRDLVDPGPRDPEPSPPARGPEPPPARGPDPVSRPSRR